MDRYQDVIALSEHLRTKLDGSDPDLLGVGVGFADDKTIVPGPGEEYAVVIVRRRRDGFAASSAVQYPDRVQARRSELGGGLSALGAGGDALVEAPVRVEGVDFATGDDFLPPPDGEPIAAQDDGPMRAAGIVAQAGEPVYVGGRWIGTGGATLKVGGQNCLVSNNHVYSIAGKGAVISDQRGQPLGTVDSLSGTGDAGTMRLGPGVGYSNEIAGIGPIKKIAKGMGLGWHGRKRGATTGLTDFHIRLGFWLLGGINAGQWAWQGVNMGGWGIPVTGQGDSGSVIVGDGNEAFALLFGGDDPVGKKGNNTIFATVWCFPIEYSFPTVAMPG